MTWWFWVPVLPKPLIVGAWALFVLLSVLLPYMYYWFNPGQPLVVSIVQGLGGNAIGVFTWSIIAIQLNAEVIHMVLSRRANEHAVEQAAEKARKQGAADARKQAMAEAEDKIAAAEERANAAAEERARTEQRQQQLLAWYEQVKDQLPEDTPPPPNLSVNGDHGQEGDGEIL